MKSKKNYPNKQFTNKNENNNNNQYLIPALFYKDFLNQFKNSKIDNRIKYVLEILDYLSEKNILKKVLI
jgi:hypothetical protein